jgi:RNA recognition motif-containing protein
LLRLSVLQVTQAELHRQFHSLGAGIIEDVRVQRDKGFGFVRYRLHEEAAYAIQAANGRVICGKSVKVSLRRKLSGRFLKNLLFDRYEAE